MFVLLRTKRMQLRNHADTQTVKRYKGYAMSIQYQILKQVRETEISLRKLSGGTAHLRTLEGTLLMNEEMS